MFLFSGGTGCVEEYKILNFLVTFSVNVCGHVEMAVAADILAYMAGC